VPCICVELKHQACLQQGSTPKNNTGNEAQTSRR
jgi:hypothetical protein